MSAPLQAQTEGLRGRDRSKRRRVRGPCTVSQQAIPVRDVAFDGFVPSLGMADIIDRHIVVLAPEEWYRVEDLSLSQHIARGGLALAFRHHPMLDADVFLRVWIGPACYITRSVDSGDAGFEERVYRDAAVDFEPAAPSCPRRLDGDPSQEGNSRHVPGRSCVRGEAYDLAGGIEDTAAGKAWAVRHAKLGKADPPGRHPSVDLRG